ncbi:MAG: hypothetical protein KIT43_01265 [Bauldia sp.]|nr:hypothetical protein [Bauldia sp.]MCW5716296.1 hypothetical protein [Bauldia sp.]
MARLPTPSARPRVTAATRRRLNQRKLLWPELDPELVWDRSTFTGFTTVPRTLSLILRIVDGLDAKKAGRVYFDLWCRAFDDFVIEVRDEFELAFSAGYEGQRAVRSWRERIAVLTDAGFVKTYRAPHGAPRMIVVLDPHPVVAERNRRGLVAAEDWLALQSLLVSIGSRPL